MWNEWLKGFKSYLQLEKSLSQNSIEAYLHDVAKLIEFMKSKDMDIAPNKITNEHIEEFLAWLYDSGLHNYSQARVLSGLKSFFKYLLLEEVIETSPVEFIQGPKTSRKLPDTLSYIEINQLLESIDLSTVEGMRNRTIIEVLYSCGLRVSECVELKISHLHLDVDFIRVAVFR